MPELYTSSNSSSNPPANINISPKEEVVRGYLIKKGHPLSSILVLPSERVKFETQEPEEKILLIVRRHFLTNIPWIFTAVLLLLAPYVLRFFPLLADLPTRFQLMFVIIWYLIDLMFVFERFLAWFFNLTIITDERIVDVDFENLTTKKIADADIDKIQDVTFSNSGVVGTIFNFGDVVVQTAAEVVEFSFDNIPNPAKIADILQHLRNEEKQEAIEGRIR